MRKFNNNYTCLIKLYYGALLSYLMLVLDQRCEITGFIC
jgi:hypothetical protein